MVTRRAKIRKEIPFTSDEKSDDSQINVILYRSGEKSDGCVYEGEGMNIKSDDDDKPVQMAAKTNSDKPSKS